MKDFFGFREKFSSLFGKNHKRGIRIVGVSETFLYGLDGKCKDYRMEHNLIVDAGFDFISNAIGLASQPSEMTHIAIGTGTTGPVGGNTTLETELTRITAAYAHSVGTKVFEFESTFGTGVGTGAITEAGILNAATTGILLDRVTFSVINKGSDDTLVQKFVFTMT